MQNNDIAHQLSLYFYMGLKKNLPNTSGFTFKGICWMKALKLAVRSQTVRKYSGKSILPGLIISNSNHYKYREVIESLALVLCFRKIN